MRPGEIIPAEGSIVLNEGRNTVEVQVENTGDRPIQVGSHYHFFEANKALAFDREKAFGYHLNIPAGTSVRFEPGENKSVELVEVAGYKIIKGFNNLVDGEVNDDNKTKAVAKAKEEGFSFK